MKSLQMSRGVHPFAGWLVIMLWCWLPCTVSAGLFEDDEARLAILELRQKNVDLRQMLDTLKLDSDQKFSEELAQLRRTFLEFQNQIETLGADLAKLRGQDEQTGRDVVELQRRLKDIGQTFDDRLRKLESNKVTVDGREFLADSAEKRDYEAALAVFRKGNFPHSQRMFEDFLNRYPQSSYRPSALFWLGNAQYVTKDYKKAVSNFRALVTIASDHIKISEALLAIANCQLELHDPKSARKTMEDLIAKYPASEAASVAKDRLARLK